MHKNIIFWMAKTLKAVFANMQIMNIIEILMLYLLLSHTQGTVQIILLVVTTAFLRKLCLSTKCLIMWLARS